MIHHYTAPNLAFSFDGNNFEEGEELFLSYTDDDDRRNPSEEARNRPQGTRDEKGVGISGW
jgi:hypothetical protein